MKRREFLTAAGAAAVSSTAGAAVMADSAEDARHWVSIRTFWVKEKADKEKVLAGFNKMIAAVCGAVGIEKFGLFTVNEALHEGDNSFDPKWKRAIIAVLESASADKLITLNDELLEKFDITKIPEMEQIFALIENTEATLQHLFPNCSVLDIPFTNDERVIQLRRYYSPNLDRNRAKRNMFDVRGEIDLFRRCGMAPVFFSETVFGPVMPNVTYMLSFENDAARKAGWEKFVNHPEWKQMSSEPEFANTAISILNLFLKPAEASKI